MNGLRDSLQVLLLRGSLTIGKVHHKLAIREYTNVRHVLRGGALISI